MPSSQRRDEKYSSVTGLIYLFNLIVGTGALALPCAVQKAGWALGITLLIVLGLFSFITVTFVIESLSVSNAVSRRNHNVIDSSSSEDGSDEEIEESPLVSRPCDSEEYVFEITNKYEVGQMGALIAPKWSNILFNILLCVYLFGDLSIYAVVIGKTSSQVFCSHDPGLLNISNTTELPGSAPCWENYILSRMNFYRLSVVTFIIIMGPFVFFNVSKTKFLQIFTSFLRWAAFLIMIIWALVKLLTEGKEGDPPVANFESLPHLFGTLIYSFMCQHSLPGVLLPISNKKHLKLIAAVVLVLASAFYLTISLTAIFTFEKIEDIYTLNFWAESTQPDATLITVILSYFLALFPIFTLSTSFPIIAITLRNNIRNIFLRDAPDKCLCDKFLFPIITILPPAALALSVSNIQLLLGVVGSYAGACVQYIIPCILVVYARSHAKEINQTNIYASPFQGIGWIYAVYVWTGISLVLISINFAIN